MAANNQTSVNESNGRGGLRQGAGRPVGSRDRGKRMSKSELLTRLSRLESLGVLQGTARRVLAALGGDEWFIRIITKLEDEGETVKAAQMGQFWAQMRDGRPAQQITVTSIGARFSADEIARARSVIRELVAPVSQARVSESVSDESIASCSPRMDGETPLMLGDGQGPRTGGEG